MLYVMLYYIYITYYMRLIFAEIYQNLTLEILDLIYSSVKIRPRKKINLAQQQNKSKIEPKFPSVKINPCENKYLQKLISSRYLF